MATEVVEMPKTAEELAAEDKKIQELLNDEEAKKNAFFDNPDNQGYYLKVKLDNGNEIKSKVFSPSWDRLPISSRDAAIGYLDRTFSYRYFLTDKDIAIPTQRIKEIVIERVSI